MLHDRTNDALADQLFKAVAAKLQMDGVAVVSCAISKIVFMYSKVFLHIPEVEKSTTVIAVRGFSYSVKSINE